MWTSLDSATRQEVCQIMSSTNVVEEKQGAEPIKGAQNKGQDEANQANF